MIRAQAPSSTAPLPAAIHAAPAQPAGRHPSPALLSCAHLLTPATRKAPQTCASNLYVPTSALSPSESCGGQQVWRPARRELLSVGLAAATAGVPWLSTPPPAHAVKELALGGGRLLEAWEFDVPLRVVALRGSLPAQWSADFQAAAGRHSRLTMQQRPQLQQIFDELGQPSAGKGKGGKSTCSADAVTMGDAWLAPAIRQGLLQPVPSATSSRWWGALYPRWQQLVQRDSRGFPSAGGAVWGAPYRWGCTLVAYRRDLLIRKGGVVIGDWSDLLQPRLNGRLGFTDSPRELVGVALKTLGLSYNSRASDLKGAGVSVQVLRERLQLLHSQVRLFSERDAARALASGDVWALVGPSEEMLSAAARSSNVALAAPASGTALWADLWTVPAAAGAEAGFDPGAESAALPSPLLPLWLEFALQPVRAQRAKGLRQGASPLLLPDGKPSPATKAALPAGISQLLGGSLPSAPVLQRSEFLFPLDAATERLYVELLSGLQRK